jgi:hypothetical protein
MSIEEHIDIDLTKISENHLAYRIIIIGIPSKEAIVKPIFGYERILYDALPIPKNSNPSKHSSKHNHLWANKAIGFGIINEDSIELIRIVVGANITIPLGTG